MSVIRSARRPPNYGSPTVRHFDCPCTYDACREHWCSPTVCAMENQVIGDHRLIDGHVPSWAPPAKTWEEELQEIIEARQNDADDEFKTAERLKSSKTIPSEHVETWLQILCPNTLCGLPLASRAAVG